MSSSPASAAQELAALRRQLEALTQQVRVLERQLSDGNGERETGAAPPEIPWLVIAAAVASVVREPHRIVSLQMPGLPPLNVWSIEGRRAVFHSHRVR